MPTWFYFDVAGNKQGPFDSARLRALVQSGVVTPQTPLLTDTGRVVTAGQVRGLFNLSAAYCTRCGSPVDEQAIVCLKCGAAPVGHQNFCRRCGAVLPPGRGNCDRCGNGVPNQFPNQPDQSYPPVAIPPSDNAGSDARGITTHETQATIQMVTWNFFCGLLALNYARAAKKAIAQGNFAEARRQASAAKWWLAAGWVSTALLLIGLIVLILLVIHKLKVYQWYG